MRLLFSEYLEVGLPGSAQQPPHGSKPFFASALYSHCVGSSSSRSQGDGDGYRKNSITDSYNMVMTLVGLTLGQPLFSAPDTFPLANTLIKPQDRHCYFPLKDGGTEAERDAVTCPRLCAYQLMKPGAGPGIAGHLFLPSLLCWKSQCFIFTAKQDEQGQVGSHDYRVTEQAEKVSEWQWETALPGLLEKPPSWAYCHPEQNVIFQAGEKWRLALVSNFPATLKKNPFTCKLKKHFQNNLGEKEN